MIVVAWFLVGLIIGAAFMWAWMAEEPVMPVFDHDAKRWRNPENGQWVKRG